jgi:hypothetical protein
MTDDRSLSSGDPETDAYYRGRLDALNEAIAIVERGPWWHLRDATSRVLRWLSDRVATR